MLSFGVLAIVLLLQGQSSGAYRLKTDVYVCRDQELEAYDVSVLPTCDAGHDNIKTVHGISYTRNFSSGYEAAHLCSVVKEVITKTYYFVGVKVRDSYRTVVNLTPSKCRDMIVNGRAFNGQQLKVRRKKVRDFQEEESAAFAWPFVVEESIFSTYIRTGVIHIDPNPENSRRIWDFLWRVLGLRNTV